MTLWHVYDCCFFTSHQKNRSLMSKCWVKIQTLPIFKKPFRVWHDLKKTPLVCHWPLHVANFQLEHVGMHKNRTKQSKHCLSSWISSSNRSSYFKNLNSLSFTPWKPPEIQTTSPVAAARGETTLACDVATPKVGRVFWRSWFVKLPQIPASPSWRPQLASSC